jgi:hypothetical protein
VHRNVTRAFAHVRGTAFVGGFAVNTQRRRDGDISSDEFLKSSSATSRR